MSADPAGKRKFWKKRPSRRKSTSAWRVIAQSEVSRLADELKLVQRPAELDKLVGSGDQADGFVEAVSGIVLERLGRAQAALVSRGRFRKFRDWYTGAALEEAWLNIHRAGEALLMIQSPGSLVAEFVQTEADFRAAIEPSDPRYDHLAYFLTEMSKVLVTKQEPDVMTAVLRSELKAVRGAANIASDTAHETVRSWRNLLVVGGLVLVLLSAGVAIVHAAVPNFYSLVPKGIAQHGDAIEPWEVMIVGSLGGALAAVLALNRFSGFTDPAGLPVVQALLRIPTAAVTSLVGVLLMQTAALDVLKPQNGATVLAYAFFFGYAQEPLLRAIDRRAGQVLGPARSKDEPAKTILPAAAPPIGIPPNDGPGGPPAGGPPAGGPPVGGAPAGGPPTDAAPEGTPP